MSDTVSLWPLTNLGGVEVGAAFDDELIRRYGFERDYDAEMLSDVIIESDEWEAEDWTDGKDLYIQVFESRIVAVAFHGNVEVHGQRLDGLTFSELKNVLGEPTTIDLVDIAGVDEIGCCDYEDGEWVFTLGFWGENISWASLVDYTYLEGGGEDADADPDADADATGPEAMGS